MIRSRTATLVAIVVLVAAWGTAVASARQSGEFDTAAFEGWELSPGAGVENGVLVVPPGEAAFRPQPWGGDTLTLDLRFEGDGVVLISFAATERGANHLVVGEDGRLILQRDAEGGVEEIGTSEPSDVSEATRFSLTIASGGEDITVAVDGETVIRSEASGETLAQGGLGIESAGERRLEIYSITGSTGEPGEPDATTQPGDTEPQPGSAATTISAAAASGTDSGLTGVLDDFFSINATNVDVVEFTINLALAGLLSFVLSRVYIHWGTALSNRRRFATNFMLIAVTTTFIILVVRSSVALSLGLVGALSIVRFRAAIKDPEELAYMFLAIGIGIGLGDNQRLITIIALAAAIVIIMLVKVFHRRQEDFNLHVTVSSDGPSGFDLAGVTEILRPHCTSMRLSRFDETAAGTEAVFLAEFRSTAELLAVRESLREAVPGVGIAFLDDKGVW